MWYKHKKTGWQTKLCLMWNNLQRKYLVETNLHFMTNIFCQEDESVKNNFINVCQCKLNDNLMQRRVMNIQQNTEKWTDSDDNGALQPEIYTDQQTHTHRHTHIQTHTQTDTHTDRHTHTHIQRIVTNTAKLVYRQIITLAVTHHLQDKTLTVYSSISQY